MSDNTFWTFFVTVCWDVLAFVACLFAFNFLRRSEYAKKIYSPKRYTDHSKYTRPKELPKGYIDWIRPLLQYSEEDVIKTAGYDAVVYLRLFSFGVRLFAVLTIVNTAIVLPVNLMGDRVDTLLSSGYRDHHGEYEIGSFDKSSMTNIHPGSNRLWAHLVSVWFITLYTVKLLWEYHHDAMDLRIRFLATAEKGVESHTVLVTDVPGLKCGSPLDRLMKSVLFKFLPTRVRKHIEESVELLLSVATVGMAQVNDLSAQVAKNVAGQLRGRSRPALKGTKNRRVLRNNQESPMQHLCVEEPEVKLIHADDVTDMEPVAWMTTKLKDQTSLEEAIELQFREVYPEDLVKCANVIYDTTALVRLLADYKYTVERLEDLIDHYTTSIANGVTDIQIAKRPLVPLVEGKWAVELYGVAPVSVNYLRFYADKLQNLKRRILKEQNSERQEQMPAAFVTFNTRWAQTVAATAFHHHFPIYWNVQAAPNPEELIWENLKYRGWERFARLLIAWGEFTVLCLMFVVPVAFVQGMLQMDRLEALPYVGRIVTYRLINGLLKAILPNLALNIFLAILPAILKRMSLQQGLISWSKVDFEVVRKYFVFQTITVFFFSFIAGSLLNQIQQLREDPRAIREILGVAAPQSATFFISYILYSGLVEGGISFLNVVNLIKLRIMTRFAGTERAKARVWKNQTMEYGVEVPNHTLVILLGLAFSVVNPIVLPVTLVYFLAMKVMWTYNMMYIYSEQYQSGGKLWEYVFEQVIVGLVIMQAMMMGLFAIKQFPYSALLTPLPFLTILFSIVMHKLYDKPLRLLSLRAAHDLDVVDEESATDEETGMVSVHDKYKHPAFLINWSELDGLSEEARRVMEEVENLNS